MFRRLLFLLPLPCLAQIVIINERWPPIPMPIPRPVPIRADCRIRSVDIHADIHDQSAKVRISQVFQNPAELLKVIPRKGPVPVIVLAPIIRKTNILFTK